MENRKSIENLNKALLNKYKIINSYDVLINRAFDERTKAEFRYIQENHKKHACKIANRILELGGVPVWVPGAIGIVSKEILKIKTKNMGTIDIIKQAYESEDKSIYNSKKILSDEMDTQSQEITQKVLSDEYNHLQILENLISEYKEAVLKDKI